ncbi:MAG: hypothetical protein ABIK36_06360 [Pseudomonadota bacterium]
MNTKGRNFNRRNLIAATAALAGLAGATGPALATADFLTAETPEAATAPVWRFAVEEVLGLGESVRVGDDEGLIVGISCIGPQQYLVQFDDDALAAKWFAHSAVASTA